MKDVDFVTIWETDQPKDKKDFLLEISFITVEHYEIKAKGNDRASFYVNIFFSFLY